MGGGYSGKFAGTAGAIGEKYIHQLSFSDKLPVRMKLGAVGNGIGGGSTDSEPVVTAEMILAMCANYRIGNITSDDLLAWLEQLLVLPRLRLKGTLRATVKQHLPKLRVSENDMSFGKNLSNFERDIRRGHQHSIEM